MQLSQHQNYQRLVALARASHASFRSDRGITETDIAHARLYAHAFRLHTIGAFHATRLAIESAPAPVGALVQLARSRVLDALADLANEAMDPVPHDFRAVVSTFYRYHQGVLRVLENAAPWQPIARRFRASIEAITSGCGIHLTQDREPPEQASFVVPNLGIVIVPLVYGDHHSWNLAWLGGRERNVPTHRHEHGVEIHLGYDPTHGLTVLGEHTARVEAGYAMPIPPQTDHGWVNTSREPHHVPFVFGSRRHSGWGVFLDVEPQPKPVATFTEVARDAAPFGAMVYLEREIAAAEASGAPHRRILIPASVTDRAGSGGLELAVAAARESRHEFPLDAYRAVSVVRGAGVVSMAGIERAVQAHDHFGIPAGLGAALRSTGNAPLVTLDAILR